MKKIRVLHVVCRMDLGGYENFIMNVMRHIDRDRFQFDFLVMKETPGYFDEEIKRMGGRIHYGSFGDDRRIFRFRKWLRKVLSNNHYDIAHCHNRYYAIAYMPLVGRYCDHIVLHSHSAGHDHSFRGLLIRFLERFANRKGASRLACSTEAGQFAFGKKSYLLCPNCISPSRFAYDVVSRRIIREKYAISEESIVLGNVGRFAPTKNHQFLIDTLKECLARGLDAYLFLCGIGSLKEHYVNEVQSDPLIEKRVVFLPPGDSSKYYSAFDFFLLPSLYEGFPMVLLEAQASGCPCLCANTITTEASLGDLVSYLPLTSAKVWADHISSLKKVSSETRQGKWEIVESSRYSSTKTSSFLQNYYLSLLNSEPEGETRSSIHA